MQTVKYNPIQGFVRHVFFWNLKPDSPDLYVTKIVKLLRMLTMKLRTPKKRQNLPPMPVMAIIIKETTQASGVESNGKSSMKTSLTTTGSTA